MKKTNPLPDNEIYRTLVENSPVGLVVLQDGRIVLANPEIAAITGYTVEELLALSAEDVQAMPHPDDRGWVVQQLCDRLAGQDMSKSSEFRFIKKDGAVRWVESSAARVDYDSRPAIQVVYKDITEKVEAKQALRESEEKYRQLFDLASDALFLLNKETTMIEAANKAAVLLYGYLQEDLVKMSAIDLSAEPTQTYQTISDTSKIVPIRYHRKKDGTIFPVEITFNDLIYSGHPMRIAAVRDITERVQGQKNLQESQQLLERTFASISDAVFVVDSHSRTIMMCNPAVEQIFGYRSEEVIGQNTAFLHVDETMYNRFGQELFSALDAAGVFHTIFKLRRKDHSIFDSEHTVKEIRNPAGERIGVVSLVRDISDRVQIEKDRQSFLRQLEMERDRLLTLIDSITDEVWFCDADGNLSLVNTAAFQGLGFERAEDIYNPMSDWLSRLEIFTADGHPRALEDAPLLRSLQGEVIRDELEIVRHPKTGERMFRKVNCAPLQMKSGQVDGAVAIVRDITRELQEEEKLRESELRFRTLFEQAPIGIDLVGFDGIPIRANLALQRLLGYTEEEMQSQAFTSWTHPEDVESSIALIRSLQAGEADHLSMEKRYMRKDGQIVWARTSVSAIRDGEGEVAYFIAMVEDITEQKRTQEMMQEMTRRLVVAQEEERQRIARELHDELGQALTAISLDLGGIEKSLPPDTSKQLRERLVEARTLADEIDERVSEIALDLRPSLLDDLGLLPTLGWYLNQFSQRLGVRVEFENAHMEERLPQDMETTLYRVIQEALTNVARHAQATTVHLVLKRSAAGLEVRIQDDGIGFDFEKTTGLAPGSRGVGLLSIRDRVSTLGGSLEIDTTPGQGTTIQIKIPRGSFGERS